MQYSTRMFVSHALLHAKSNSPYIFVVLWSTTHRTFFYRLSSCHSVQLQLSDWNDLFLMFQKHYKYLAYQKWTYTENSWLINDLNEISEPPWNPRHLNNSQSAMSKEQGKLPLLSLSRGGGQLLNRTSQRVCIQCLRLCKSFEWDLNSDNCVTSFSNVTKSLNSLDVDKLLSCICLMQNYAFHPSILEF